MEKRMDRYIQGALKNFAKWYVEECPEWMGKERDCVNIFATRFLMESIGPSAAIQHREQIRIEGGVMQPSNKERFPRPSATKDLVIWNKPLDTAWDESWGLKKNHAPRAIIEWKTRRSGNPCEHFDGHDKDWMEAFTDDHKTTFGFLVSTHATRKHRSCMWAMVRSGTLGKIHPVS